LFGGDIPFQEQQNLDGDGTALAASAFAEGFVEVIGDVFDVKSSPKDILGKSYADTRAMLVSS